MSRSHRASQHEPGTAVELNPLFSRPGESTIFPRFTLTDTNKQSEGFHH
jgi:glutamate decarboxylase